MSAVKACVGNPMRDQRGGSANHGDASVRRMGRRDGVSVGKVNRVACCKPRSSALTSVWLDIKSNCSCNMPRALCAVRRLAGNSQLRTKRTLVSTTLSRRLPPGRAHLGELVRGHERTSLAVHNSRSRAGVNGAALRASATCRKMIPLTRPAAGSGKPCNTKGRPCHPTFSPSTPCIARWPCAC